ncbi:MAG: choice-of-anchor B family protein [Saprospiraceae bacterium]
MKKSLFFLFFALAAGTLLAQDSLNMTLLARWDDDSLPVASPGGLNLQYSGCWGMALNGREYAILGGALHVLIFDVTNPTKPELLGKFAGKQNTIWREFKSYKNRFYAVSDQTQEGLMIFDMSQAPDTIIQTYFSNALFNRSHTITLDTVSGRIYLNGSGGGSGGISNGLLLLDVKTDPDNPRFLSSINLDVNAAGGYVHDSYVRNDTVFASSGYEGLFVLDCTDPDTCIRLAQVETTGYNHNSWASADGQYQYYTEEIPAGRPVRIVSLKNLALGDIEVVGGFLDNMLEPDSVPKAIPHNVYIKDSLLFNSQYEDGLLVYDISEPENPVLTAYYDTHPQNTTYNTYYGNWGNYPWLPSGTIIAGDMQNGLHLLRLQKSSAVPSLGRPSVRPRLWPNPVDQTLLIEAPDVASQLEVFDAQGRLMVQQRLSATRYSIPVSDWPEGLYMLRIQTSGGQSGSNRFVVQH